MKKEWNIQAAEIDFINNQLPLCTTQLERDCAKALHGQFIRMLAQKEISLKGKISPAALAIAAKYGFRI